MTRIAAWLTFMRRRSIGHFLDHVIGKVVLAVPCSHARGINRLSYNRKMVDPEGVEPTTPRKRSAFTERCSQANYLPCVRALRETCALPFSLEARYAHLLTSVGLKLVGLSQTPAPDWIPEP